ncbi:SRPBCC domain-containing protein [Reichenbachiella agarivorans]|uniref:SRPBCC domain-containing protein n=1 Tax=Reichenbachiella agarivorans TaxID=2979464 RepID=A0ABY6CPK2_9BACT|nr:SRPBCC domain-containing protein [Reichenbachiella agarivorans]UXP31388.1 SRPBCC domain-containing protein [Reichenbachiella agarivorans]
MKNENYTTTLLVNQSPKEVFNAITNVRGWWSEQIEGNTAHLNDEFRYHYKDIHSCHIKLIEVVEDEKIIWQVVDNYFNFTKDKSEWKGTKISFEIIKKDNKTALIFTHIGLIPSYECYDICTDSWGNYITGSLRSLIETGKGQPNPYIPAIKNAVRLKEENKE